MMSNHNNQKLYINNDFIQNQMEFQRQWEDVEVTIQQSENVESMEMMSIQELRTLLKCLKHENLIYLEDFGY